MSKKPPAQRSSTNPSKEQVGYKCPPRHSQFKPGKSGNPAGRPKKERKSEAEILEAVLDRPVTVKKGGTEVRMASKEVMLEKLMSLAMTGNLQATKLMISLMDKLGIAAPKEDPVQVAHFPPSAKTYDEWLINIGRKRPDGSDPAEDVGRE